ncbi:type II RES/Xre toxin-antitoxin system antitoxin [Planctomicrobium piriforme]|uniref:Putative toxin-antitoxin system antitoxin component, TIGR02293 family n=1 Tax=Planctomicrobium piriforme TaxID=1576369 RepID=A0A1I3ASA2_9PLAN|nr:antitoxin Xre/MbcA/ParS toxin-binding domain-containing protein [Planctomicrobium piriforme]SFH52957.1 putative toxin-antitoxin system antitoxin component, TIGR02293 family [Planctomicrobium piriforme]
MPTLVSPPDFTLFNWTEKTTPVELRAVLRKRNRWVVSGPRSLPVWYAVVLGNLSQRFVDAPADTIEVVRSTLAAGLDKVAFDRLKQITAVSAEDLSRVVQIPLRTLARRQKFKPDESERILRVACAFQRTLEVLDDLSQARRWFSTPKRALGEKTPLEFCDTGPGADEVMHLLGRMEHGVFS